VWPAPANSARRRGLEREEGESQAKHQTANADHAGKPRGKDAPLRPGPAQTLKEDGQDQEEQCQPEGDRDVEEREELRREAVGSVSKQQGGAPHPDVHQADGEAAGPGRVDTENGPDALRNSTERMKREHARPPGDLTACFPTHILASDDPDE